MRKVLVTGSLGYIGSVLTGYLQERGFDCVGYDAGFFKDCLLYEPAPVTTVIRDMRDFEEKDLDGVHSLVHLAGISNDPFGNLGAAEVYDPTRAYSLEVAKLCKKRGVKFIFASSCSVYGKGQEDLLTEDSPVFPQTPYSLNKLQIEEDLRAISDKDFSPIALRFATAFGLSPRMRFDIVVNMLAGMAVATGKVVLNSDGSPWRPNIHVLDICKSIELAANSDYRGGKLLVLNVGSESNNLQIINIAKMVQARVPGCELRFLQENPELDKEGLIRDRKLQSGADTRTYKISFARVKKCFPNFVCDWSVEGGIKEMIGKLKEMKFTEADFNNKNFYRLQKIEHLYQNGYLSPDLRWKKVI